MLDGIQEIYLLDSNGFTVEVAVSEKYDILTNASSVTVGLRVKSAYKLGVQYFSGSIKIDGTKLLVMDSTVSTHNIQFLSYNTWYKVVRSSDRYTDSPWTAENIAHDSEGVKNITLELEMRSYGADDYLGLRVATTKTITLTKIPRASTVAATDANIGAVSAISVIRRVPSYTHSIAYRFGALSGYLRADGSVSASEVKLTETSIPFRLPESFYGQIPNAPAGDCVLTIRTYWGSEQIGDAQTAKFTATADKKLCMPRISGTVEDTNANTIALTGDKNILVRYGSNALCSITATAQNSASIVSKTIGGVAVSGNDLTMEATQTGTVLFACRDSRGYEASAEVKKSLVPYVPLSASVSAARTDPTSGNVKLIVSGICFNGSVGAANNALTVSCRVNNEQAIAVEAVFDGNAYTAQTILSGLDYQRTHTISVTAADKLQTVTKSQKVGKGIPVFDWDEDDFQFHVPVSLEGNKLTDLGDPESDTDAVNVRTMNAALSGKAPAGYGLGTAEILLANWDYATENGWYAAGGNSPDGYAWHGIVHKYTDNYIIQNIYSYGNANDSVRQCLRVKNANGWGKWHTVGEVQKLLWENASRTSSFEGQTISLDLSGYDEVLIYACLNHGQYNMRMVVGRCPVGEGFLLNYVGANDGYKFHRVGETSNAGVVFNNGWYQGTTDNRSCIPYQIYGIKGVSQ